MARPLLRRAARALGLAALALAALSGGASAWLFSSPGEAWLRARALVAAAGALEGKLDFARLSLSPSHVRVEDIRLDTSEGEPALRARAVDLSWDPLALLDRRVHVEALAVEGLELPLVQDGRGLNLSRALASKGPSSGTPRLAFQVDALRVPGAAVTFTQVDADGERTEAARLPALSLEASASGTTVPLGATLKLAVDGTAEVPVKGPLQLRLDGTLEGESLSARGTAALAGAEAAFEGRRDGTEQSELKVGRLLLPPEPLRALVAQWPLQLPLSATLSAAQTGNLVSLKADASAGAATAALSGKVDLARFRLEHLQLDAAHVDLSELLEGGPPSSLTVTAHASGHGTLETLTGGVELDVSPGTLYRAQVGPLRVRATARDGKLDVQQLSAVLPGASLRAAGGGNAGALELKGTLEATDLGALSRTLGAFTRSEPLPLSGRGRLALTARGPARALAVTLSGRFPQLAYDGAQLEGVLLDASLPDVRRPWEASGKVKVAQATVGGRRFRELSAEVATRGRAVTVDARLRGLTSLVFHAGGTLDKDRQGLGLDVLGLDYPEAQWTLAAPAAIRFNDSGVQLQRLALTARGQSLSLVGGTRNGRLDATLALDRLDLSRLPSALMPEGLGLQGRVTGTARVQGRTFRPEADVELSVVDGRVKQLSGVGLHLLAGYRADRLRGSAALSAEPGRARVTFDVPVKGLQQERHEPLALSLALQSLDVAKALAAAGRTDAAEGRLSGNLQLSGFADEPVPHLHLEAEGLRANGWPGAGVAGAAGQLDVAPGEDGGLGLSLLADVLSSRVRARLKTGLTLASLRRAPPDEAALRALPWKLEVDSEALPLGPHLPGVQGDAALSVRAHGSLEAPEGEVTLQLTGVRRTGAEPLSGTVHLRATGAEVSFDGSLERAVAPLLSVEGRIRAPAGALLADALHSEAPLEAHAVLSPTALASLAALAGRPLAAQGELSADVRASGTPARPVLHAELSADRLGAGAQALGALRLAADVRPALASLEGALTAPGGGTLKLSLRSARDWFPAALAGTLEAAAVPLDGSAEAKGVDLSFLAGMHPKLRTLSGTLDLSARLQGTAAEPLYLGQAEWKDGRVAWLGYGEYRDVTLKARVTHERARLDTLSLSSGGGTFTAHGEALKRPTGWTFTGGTALRRFPLILDDQLYAYASLDGALKGEWDDAVANFSEVRLPNGVEVELPQAKRKDLQDLERPGDVFRTRDGRWLDGLPRKLREAQPRTGTEAPPGRLWRASLQSEKGVMVRGMDLVAVLGLAEGFRVEYQDALRLYGEVRLLSGRFEVLGRRFVVQKDSTVQFQGAAKSPLVNVAAAWTSEREQVTVNMAVRGTGSDLQLRPTSQPPLPESDIYTLLATGRRQLKRGSGSSMTGAEAATLVGSALASQLRKALPGKVPLDVLTVEAGEEGSLSGSKLEAGTYVTDKVYVGYTGRLGANPQRGENGHEVRFEYQVTPQWSLEASFGDAFSGGADLVWTRDY